MGAGDDGEREESLMFGWWGGSRVGLDLGQLGISCMVGLFFVWDGLGYHLCCSCSLLGGGGFQVLVLDCLYQHGGSLPSALPPL